LKFLEKILDKKVKPLFIEGGRLNKFFFVYEALDTFLFVTDRQTDTGAHVRDPVDLKRMMITVVYAMIPCIVFGIYNAGYQQLLQAGQETVFLNCFIQGLAKFLPLVLVVYTAGGVVEMIFAVIRKHEINEGFLVTGMLIALILPPTIPLWQAAVGTMFGVMIGKEIFGGTGMNILNPALTSRAFIFFAYPVQISGDKVWVSPNTTLILNGVGSEQAVSVATPLAKAANVNLAMDVSTWDLFFGLIPGSLGETSALCCLIGALILIFCRIASWRTIDLFSKYLDHFPSLASATACTASITSFRICSLMSLPAMGKRKLLAICCRIRNLGNGCR